jgi:hypothetical protein
MRVAIEVAIEVTIEPDDASHAVPAAAPRKRLRLRVPIVRVFISIVL